MSTTGGVGRIYKAFVMNPRVDRLVEPFNPGYLIVNGDRIEQLVNHDPRAQFEGAEFIDLGERTIVPGFVDTHIHLPQFAIMGRGSGELLSWLNTYTYPEEARFADPKYASRISVEFFDALVANGTTAAAIYSSVHEEATNIAF